MPPTIAGRYDIIRTLGQGAFGRTFLARDQAAGRDVAIKLLDARGATDLKPYELFEREATVLRSLRHHAIPEIFDTLRDKWDGIDAPFLIMEYVEGTSLAQLIESKRHMEHDEVMHVLLELLSVLEYLHGRVPPILHRDIKPANIIVRPNGFPALVDFGSVRRVFFAPEESGSTVAGTYGYMPYEQYMGQASPASDLYAVGATMLHLVTGRPPNDFMIAEGRIDVPADLSGDARLRDTLARMLRPSPAERFQSAKDVRQALLAPAALALATASRAVSASRRSAAGILGPAPRAVEGAVKERFEALTYPWWRLADSGSKHEEGSDIWSWGVTIFFCTVTAGILPAVFVSIARERNRRLRRFFAEGTHTFAVITAMRDESTAFGAKMMRVNYEFDADGESRRDSDAALPVVADRWRIGDTIEVLYIAEKNYDSVIISG